MSAPPPSRMPATPVPPDAPPGHAAASARPADRWRTAGLVLLAVWSSFFAAGVAVWVRVAFFPSGSQDPHGYVAVFGAPFVLVALGLLWWAWWSARALRRGRRDGWVLLLVLGGVAVAQTVMTAPAVVGSLGGAGSTAGTGGTGAVAGSGAPREVVAGMLAAIVLGLASVAVAVLARRSWAADDAARTGDAQARRT